MTFLEKATYQNFKTLCQGLNEEQALKQVIAELRDERR